MKCGFCKDDNQDIEHVKNCAKEHYLRRAQELHEMQEAQSEADMEDRQERFHEEGPHGPEYDPRERELWADEDRAKEERAQMDEELIAANRLDELEGVRRTNTDPPSDKQVRYALDLLEVREWPDAIYEADLRLMARRQVSKLINALNAAPVKEGAGKSFQFDLEATVPAGRYAVAATDGGEVRFYQIDKPTQGSWAGRTFVTLLIGAPGDFKKAPVKGMRASRVLTQIAEDPKAAAILFGKETQQCGICHSELTVKASRDRGIGPKCAKKSGWF